MKRYERLCNFIDRYTLSVGAQIGTGSGITSAYLLKNSTELKTLIEIAYYPVPNGKKGSERNDQQAKALWKKRIKNTYGKTIIPLEMTSEKALEFVENESLDFIFIDADHSFKHCYFDLSNWYHKLKSNRLMFLHDYGHYTGVTKAVNQFFDEMNIKLNDESHNDHLAWGIK